MGWNRKIKDILDTWYEHFPLFMDIGIQEGDVRRECEIWELAAHRSDLTGAVIDEPPPPLVAAGEDEVASASTRAQAPAAKAGAAVRLAAANAAGVDFSATFSATAACFSAN